MHWASSLPEGKGDLVVYHDGSNQSPSYTPTQHERVTTYVLKLQRRTAWHTTGGGNRGLWSYTEALLGRYQMRYLDRSQGPPVYPGYERVKSVNGIAGWNFWMITTVRPERARPCSSLSTLTHLTRLTLFEVKTCWKRIHKMGSCKAWRSNYWQGERHSLSHGTNVDSTIQQPYGTHTERSTPTPMFG